MKNSTKVNLITIASFFLVGAILMLIGGAKADWKKDTLLPSVTYTEETYEISASKVQSLDCYVANANIVLTCSTDHRVHVSYYNSTRGAYAVTLDEKSGELTIRYHDKSFLAQYLQIGDSMLKHELRIAIPADTLKKLSVKTNEGYISAAMLGATESLQLTSTNGSITLDGLIPAQATKLTSSNGSITGTLNASGTEFKVTSDDEYLSSFQDGEKELTVATTSGTVHLRFLLP